MTDKAAAPTQAAKTSSTTRAAQFAAPAPWAGVAGAEQEAAPPEAAPRPVFHFGKIPIQAKLQVGPEGDAFEKEADATAERVMRMPDPAAKPGGEDEDEDDKELGREKWVELHPGAGTVQRERETRGAAAGGEGDKLQRKAAGRAVAESAAPAIVHEVLRSPGQPLDAGTRAFMEPRFGRDFRGVRVHEDVRAGESARAVRAHAYTVGSDVVFARGRYAPGTPAGRRLLAHELAHVVQQSGAPAAEGEQADAPGAAPAGTVAAGAGHAPGAALQRDATELAKKVWKEIKDATGYDIVTGDLEVDIDLASAVAWLMILGGAAPFKKIEWLDPDKLGPAGKATVHLTLNVYLERLLGAKITIPALHLAGFKLSAFACDDIVLTGVMVEYVALGPKVVLDVGEARLHGVHFQEYKVGYGAVRELTCAELIVPPLHVDTSHVNDEQGWLLDVDLGGVKVRGLVYPGLPPVNVDVDKSAFTLRRIGSVLAPPSPPSDEGLLAQEVPGVLPPDSHVDVKLLGAHGAAIAEIPPGQGTRAPGDASNGFRPRVIPGAPGKPGVAVGGFNLFSATVIGADGKELCSVAIEGFEGFGVKAGTSGEAAGHIDKFTTRGSPSFLPALLSSEPVHARAANALAVLESAGIKTNLGVNVTLTNINVSAEGDGGQDKGRVSAGADLSADIVVPDVGTLSVKLQGFTASYKAGGGDGSLGANFERFAATLTGGSPPKELASVELGAASGYVDIEDDQIAGGGASTQFSVRGEIGGLFTALGAQLKKLPRPVRKILPVVRSLAVRGGVVGSVDFDARQGAFYVGGDLDVTLEAAGGNKVKLGLTGFHAGKEGPITAATFRTFNASLLDKGGRPVATVFAEKPQVQHAAEGAPSPGDELVLPKLVVTGDVGSVGALAAGLTRNNASLPPNVRRTCEIVAKHAIAMSAGVTLKDVHADLSPGGDERLTANLSANVFLPGVGSLHVAVDNFREAANIEKDGPKRVGFDRLALTLMTLGPNPKQAASLTAAADLTVGGGAKGKDFAVEVRQVEVTGDAKRIEAMMQGASEKLKFLPENIRQVFAAVSKFKVNGGGSLHLDKLEVSGRNGDIHAKADLTAGFELTGAGEVTLAIKGFKGDSTKTATLVHFDSFVATLKGAPPWFRWARRALHWADEAARWVTGAKDPDESLDATISITPSPPAAGEPGQDESPGTVKGALAVEGSAKGVRALVKAIPEHFDALPVWVQTAFGIALKSLDAGASAKLTGDNVTLGKQDGHVVGKGQMSLSVDFPGIGHVELKLVGKEDKDGVADTSDATGFKSLSLQVTDDEGKVAASLTIEGATIPAAGTGKVLTADLFEITGDATLIHRLIDQAPLKFPVDVSDKLRLIDRSKLNSAAAHKLVVKQDGDRIATHAADLTTHASIHFTDGAKQYDANDMMLLLKDADVVLDEKHELESVGAKSLDGTGAFTYKTDEETIEGKATLKSGEIHARLAPKPIHLNVQGVSGTGEIERKVDVAQARRAAASAAEAKAERDKAIAHESPQPSPAEIEAKKKRNEDIVSAASLVKTASISLTLPVKAGRYGDPAVTVAPGTNILLELWIANNAITSAHIAIHPAFSVIGSSIHGIDLETHGKDQGIRTDINWFVDWLTETFMPTITQRMLGQREVPLDLEQLATVVTSRFMDPNPKPAPEKPNEKKYSDIATQGFDREGISGSAYVEVVASKETILHGATVTAGSAISLEGTANRGSIFLSADAKAKQAGATVAGYTIGASKVGASVRAQDLRHIKITEFTIKEIDVAGPAGEKNEKKPADKTPSLPAEKGPAPSVPQKVP